jgi:hypothetical protein
LSILYFGHYYFLSTFSNLYTHYFEIEARVKRQADDSDGDNPDVESTTKKCHRKKGGRNGDDSDSSDDSGVLEAQKQGKGKGSGSGMQRRGPPPQQSGSSSGSKNGKNQAQVDRQQQQGPMMGRMSSNTNGKFSLGEIFLLKLRGALFRTKITE